MDGITYERRVEKEEKKMSNECRYKSQYKLAQVLGRIVQMALFTKLKEEERESQNEWE